MIQEIDGVTTRGKSVPNRSVNRYQNDETIVLVLHSEKTAHGIGSEQSRSRTRLSNTKCPNKNKADSSYIVWRKKKMKRLVGWSNIKRYRLWNYCTDRLASLIFNLELAFGQSNESKSKNAFFLSKILLVISCRVYFFSYFENIFELKLTLYDN